MRYSIDYTSRFRKSLKKCVKRGLKPDLVEEVVSILSRDGMLPTKYKAHKLHGSYDGVWECHIAADWLLLWLQDDDKLTLLLLDTGTHSDLF